MRLLWLVLLSNGGAAAGQQVASPQPSTELTRAVEEFKIQTRNLGIRSDSPASAKARLRGSQAKWHGRVFENFRNDFLDAVPHEIKQRGGSKSLLRRNQFGFNLAGPLAVPKLWAGFPNTWFSVSYEGTRERISRSSLRTIATAPERSGDFSATVDSAGNPLTVYDWRTTHGNPSFDPAQPVSLENLQYVRQPFPSNTIPTALLDPVGQKSLAYYPLPNTDVGPFFRNNYFVVSPETTQADGMLAKVDHTRDDRHRFELGMSFSNGFAGAARLFDTIADSGPADRTYATRRGSIEHVYTRSARTINTFTFEAVTDQNSTGREGIENATDEIGLAGPVGLAFPYYRLTPYLGMGRANPVSRTARNTFIWTDGLTLKRGKHSLRFVGQIIRYQVNVSLPTFPAGYFRFSEGLTSLPGINNTGHTFASYLLGLAEYGEVTISPSPSYFRRSTGLAAVRETYEVSRGLTLSFGLNLETSTPRVEKYNSQSTVDLETINPANGRPGALIAAARNGLGRSFQPIQFRAEPSASLSWNPAGSSKTVVRISYGRSYQAPPIYSTQWGTQGFVGAPAFLSVNPQLEPALTLRTGIPPLEYPLPDIRPEAANDTGAELTNRSKTIPTYQSFGFSLERALPASIVLTLGLGHSQGRNLFLSSNSAQPNAIHPDALVFRDRLNDEAFNRSLRPYPQYRTFDVYAAWPVGRYQRDAGYLRMEKRSSMGLTMTAYFEFSKQMDDYSGPSGAQDFFNRRNEWSLTAYNNPQRFSLSYAYELPIGASKLLFSYADWRKHLVDGWSISGMTSVNSGEPLALRPMFNNTGRVTEHLNVNVVPGVDPAVANRGPDMWFNPAAFGQPADFTLGDASRTHPRLRNPGTQNHDLSLTKRFVIAPERTVEFSAVGFNFLNHGNWNDPDNVIGPESSPNVNAGKIIGSRGGRIIQLGLRFSF